jgi:hypothetical protein
MNVYVCVYMHVCAAVKSETENREAKESIALLQSRVAGVAVQIFALSISLSLSIYLSISFSLSLCV